MSNHGGSNMSNEVLLLLEEYGFFKHIGAGRISEFVKSIVDIGNNYDCNNSEILEEIGEKIGICYLCLESAKNFEHGICKKCKD